MPLSSFTCLSAAALVTIKSLLDGLVKVIFITICMAWRLTGVG